MKSKILVVDDEPDALEVIAFKLKEAGYVPLTAADGLRAVEIVRDERPALVVLDLMLPKMDGLEVCKILRRDPTTAAIPIIMLTARAAEMDRIVGLELGADDYVTKPFSATELLARVRAALRRVARGAEHLPVLQFAGVSVDLGARTASGPGGELHLTPTEYRVLGCLAHSAGLIVSQRQLIGQAWGPDRIGDARSLRFHISKLRQKLEPDPGRPRFILTEAGVGYRLAAIE
jgi:DNA-binding response OmpR family regulator